jgi:hypothetical protein
MQLPTTGMDSRGLPIEGLTHRFTMLVLAFLPSWPNALEACLAAGVDIMHVTNRSSARLHAVLGVTAAEAVARTRAMIRRVKLSGRSVAFVPSDSTLAELDVVKAMWSVAAEAGVDRVYVADSVGIATPVLIGWLVCLAREVTGLPVGVHCHNDFGVALANSVAGVRRRCGVTFKADPTVGLAADMSCGLRVILRLTNRSEVCCDVDVAKGKWAGKRLSDPEIEAKFRASAASVGMSTESAGEIAEMAAHLDSLEEAGDLMRPLAAVVPWK